MCGILGIFATDEHSNIEFLSGSIRGLIGLMQRRGPDDEFQWADERCALGFRRLAILDLSPTGRQPMVTADGKAWLVFNGELYNFRTLRTELEARGIHFRSSGDAEVALYALMEWGPKALEKFNGMYALAFYNTLNASLLLARDHAGIKPLYYLKTRRGLVFASQYNQLLHHPWGHDLEVDPEALGLYLRLGHIPAPKAIMKHTYLLEAGSWLTINSNGRVEQGRSFNFPVYTVPELRGDQAINALDEALKRSITRHLISDVPVGVFLSSGIDSPLVAALARQVCGDNLQAFTIKVDDPQMDEATVARRYASELGLDLYIRRADASTALALLDDVVEASSEPTADFSIFPTLLVSQLAAEHVKVALSGDGGDELFWGYPERFGSALDQSYYYRFSRPRRMAEIAKRKLLGIGRANSDALWHTVGRMYQKKHTLLNEADLHAVFPNLPELPVDFDLFKYDGFDPDETAQWLRWNEFQFHLQRVLLKVDRASMHHSLEVRVPLLDKEVIAVACRIDWHECLDMRQRVGKMPLRRLLHRNIQKPSTKKMGFAVPMHKWLAGPLGERLEEEVLQRKDILGLSVQPAHLRHIHAQMIGGDKSKAWGLWLLLSLVLWEQRHLRPAQSTIKTSFH